MMVEPRVATVKDFSLALETTWNNLFFYTKLLQLLTNLIQSLLLFLIFNFFNLQAFGFLQVAFGMRTCVVLAEPGKRTDLAFRAAGNANVATVEDEPVMGDSQGVFRQVFH